MKPVRLPNGLVIQALNGTEADMLYHEIFTMQSYQKHGIQITNESCVFDVGANIGLYSIFLTQKYPTIRLFSFEPIPALFDVLHANATSLFSGANVQLQNVGLAAKTGTAQFTFKPSMSMTASMYPDVLAESSQKQASSYTWLQAFIGDMAKVSRFSPGLARWGIRGLSHPYLRPLTLGILGLPILAVSAIQNLSTQRITCSLKTISDVIREQCLSRIDVIKIDVEGSELDVIQGIEAADWPKIRQFIIEVHDLNDRVNTLVALFKKHGFRTTVDQEDWELHKLMNIYTLYAIAD
ncbi:FkbM family methyltransferase [Spirosoma harenae]